MNKGIIALEEIVNENGSIYRGVPGDKDTGIDGFIEFVDLENVTGHLIAVQVKTGDSYYNLLTNEFELNFDSNALYKCTDNCLGSNEQKIIDSFLILSNHPYSKGIKLTLFIARHLLKSNNETLLKEIL